jgi:hypothetical protein
VRAEAEGEGKGKGERRALGRGREALRPQAASVWRRLLVAAPCLPLGWRAAPCDRTDFLR